MGSEAGGVLAAVGATSDEIETSDATYSAYLL